MTRALAVQNPRHVETQLVSALNSLPGIRIVERDVIGKDGQFEIGPMTVDLGPEADLPAIRSMVEEACRPAPLRDTVEALTRLALVTAHQSPWTEATLSAYADLLADYPGDAVLDVVQNWHKRGSKWFPTGPEIVESVEIRARRRLRIRDALRRQEMAA